MFMRQAVSRVTDSMCDGKRQFICDTCDWTSKQLSCKASQSRKFHTISHIIFLLRIPTSLLFPLKQTFFYTCRDMNWALFFVMFVIVIALPKLPFRWPDKILLDIQYRLPALFLKALPPQPYYLQIIQRNFHKYNVRRLKAYLPSPRSARRIGYFLL